MGVDTYVHLRVRDRGALREALAAHAAETPLMYPHADGSVSIFTGLRFHDPDMEFGIRGWLHVLFGEALSRIHDDPRGVFVTPDVSEPRAKTYDGIVAELKDAGRFIDPSPPTPAEQEARVKSMEESLAAIQAYQEALAAGDEEAMKRVLATAPEEARATLTAQADLARRMEALTSGPKTFEVTDLSAFQGAGGEDVQRVAQDAAMAVLRQMMGGPPEGAADGPADLTAMFAKLVEQSTVAMAADPLGSGRVAMLLPAALVKALGDHASSLDIQERKELADGSVIIVTSRIGEAVMEAATLAEALAGTSFDRAAVGALPFFRESLVEEAATQSTFAAAQSTLGDRVELLPLRTWDERLQDDKKSVDAWLKEKPPVS